MILVAMVLAATLVAAAAPEPVAEPVPVASTPQPVRIARPVTAVVTPNAERVVTIAALDKRTGETRDFVGRPGQYFDFGQMHVTVRTCETTPPVEQKLTGAFLLIDERAEQRQLKRIYAGWMFAESPSLNPLEHPRYDIWVKSCVMRFPEIGPATIVAGRGDTAPAAKASIAKKSAATVSAPDNSTR